MEGPQPVGSPELEMQTEETIAGGDRLEALCRWAAGQAETRLHEKRALGDRCRRSSKWAGLPSFWQGFALYKQTGRVIPSVAAH